MPVSIYCHVLYAGTMLSPFPTCHLAEGLHHLSVRCSYLLLLFFRWKGLEKLYLAADCTMRGWWSQDSNPSPLGSQSTAGHHYTILLDPPTAGVGPRTLLQRREFPRCLEAPPEAKQVPAISEPPARKPGTQTAGAGPGAGGPLPQSQIYD